MVVPRESGHVGHSIIHAVTQRWGSITVVLRGHKVVLYAGNIAGNNAADELWSAPPHPAGGLSSTPSLCSVQHYKYQTLVFLLPTPESNFNRLQHTSQLNIHTPHKSQTKPLSSLPFHHQHARYRLSQVRRRWPERQDLRFLRSCECPYLIFHLPLSIHIFNLSIFRAILSYLPQSCPN